MLIYTGLYRRYLGLLRVPMPTSDYLVLYDHKLISVAAPESRRTDLAQKSGFSETLAPANHNPPDQQILKEWCE